LEAIIRLSVFVGFLAVMILWEIYAPRRQLLYSRWQRWRINFSLSVLGMLLVRFTIGAAAYVAAITAENDNIGLLNQFILPEWLSIAMSLLLLDLAIYGQHVASHKWKWLWRLHKVHHTDLDFDVSTAVRFHPIEIIISMIYKVFIIYIIGISAVAVITFEVILSSTALFTHSNISIPEKWDARIRKLFVTPDMHRIHHSVIPKETDSNYGFSISVWDRVFGTYTKDPRDGHQAMKIGLADYRHSYDVGLKQLLTIPFKSK
jgi:sterol desaturase/sphingolipid hydroxylase (fatty acid hydroxylase superfamily)